MIHDDEPTPPPRRLTPPALDTWDVGELGEYIAELRAEIARAQSFIDRKQSHRLAADAFFRTPPA